MRVTVNVYAFLRQYLPEAEGLIRQKAWEVPGDATAADVVERLKLPKGVRVTVLVNNNIVDQKRPLQEGDVVHILPLMSGG